MGAEAALVAVMVAGYVAVLRRYGLELFDEGTLVAQFGEVARGAVPYRDFETGYGPLVFYWNAALLRWVGEDVATVRAGLACVHGASAALLYLVARGAGGAGVAAMTVAVVWGMLRPVAPGAFATFNIPYPAWWAEGFGYAAILMAGGSAVGYRRLVGAGALWGLAFLAKQNAGLLGLGGAVLYLGLAAPPGRGRGATAAGAALAIAVAGGFAVLAAAVGMTTLEALLLGTPVVLLALAVVRRRPALGAAARIGALVAGFVAMVAPAAVAIAGAAGWGVVRSEMLHLGADPLAGFRVAYPSVAAAARDAWRAGNVWWRTARHLVDAGWLFVLPAIAAALAIRLLVTGREVRPQERAIAAIGPLLLLQVLPRADTWHVLPAAGLLVAGGLIVVRGACAGRWRFVRAAVVTAAVLRSLPTGPVVLSALRPAAAEAARVPRAALRWDLMEPAHLRAIPAAVAALGRPESLFAFPALGLFNFVTQARAPVRERYFFPGHLDPAATARLLTRLDAARPAASIWVEGPIAFAPEALAAYPEIARWLRASAWDVREIGPFRVGRRRTP